MTPSAAERFLVDFHARHAGATTVALGDVPVRCEGASFASSYDLLVAHVPPGARRVLDIACGDGFLLSRLLAGRPIEATGVDMSADELALAEARLKGAATLVRCKAQALPFADATFDVVVSHMALMLMDDPARVCAEIRRTLGEHGKLAAVIGAPFPSSAVFDAYRALIGPHIAASAGRVAIGDSRWRTPEGVRGLLLESGFRRPAVHDIDGDLVLQPARLWDWFMLMYDAHFVDPATRDAVRGEFIAAMAPRVDGSGNVGMPIRWWLVMAQA